MTPEPRSLQLLDLPQEIIALILQFLLPPRLTTTFPPRFPTSSSYSDLVHTWTASSRPPWPHPPAPKSLSAFLQVCKRGSRLATPLLYHSINLHTIISTNKLARTLQSSPSLGSLIRHLHLPNDGLLHGSSDRMADKQDWVHSLRIILNSTPRLETIFLATRPGGEALQELMHFASTFETGMVALKRVTISSLSFSFPNLGAGLLHAPNLSHLHLVQWIPPTLSERFGPTLYQSLQVLRLSRIPSSAVRLPEVGERRRGEGMRAQQLFDLIIRISPQPLLLLLRECIEQLVCLHTVLLEVEQLADLDMPQHLTPWQQEQQQQQQGRNWDQGQRDQVASTAYTGGFGVPFEQFTAGQPGQLASLDFPADLPISAAESEEWAQREEDARCQHRLLYWSQLKLFKQLLIEYSKDMRNNGSQQKRPAIDFRIVAPRTLGWDRNESYIDFNANASACRGEIDYSAFQDEDVFALVDSYPHLGHDYGSDQMGQRVAYWTGTLPLSEKGKTT